MVFLLFALGPLSEYIVKINLIRVKFSTLKNNSIFNTGDNNLGDHSDSYNLGGIWSRRGNQETLRDMFRTWNVHHADGTLPGGHLVSIIIMMPFQKDAPTADIRF